MYNKFLQLIILTTVLLCSVQSFAAEGKKAAYFGAPPTIPHGVEEEGRFDCLACHENGLVVNGIKSTITPHPELLNCRQCHLNQKNITPFGANTFQGLEAPQKTYRQNPYAPPLIPHRTLMFTKCLTCHYNKALAQNIVQTNHPERQNCKQCHLDTIDVTIFTDSDVE